MGKFPAFIAGKVRQGDKGLREDKERRKRPLEDCSAGFKLQRESGKLDESLRERIARTKEETSFLPAVPFQMKTEITETAEGIILEIPSGGITVSLWVQMGMSLVFSGIGLYLFSGFLRLPAPPVIRYLFGGFLLILILAPPLAALRYMHREARSSTRVTVTPVFLRVEERAGGKNKVTEIPADELEEMDLPAGRDWNHSIRIPDKSPQYDLPESGIPRLPDGRPMPKILVSLVKLAKSAGIIARSDAAWVQFGSGLPEDELKYLQALIKKILTRR